MDGSTRHEEIIRLVLEADASKVGPAVLSEQQRVNRQLRDQGTGRPGAPSGSGPGGTAAPRPPGVPTDLTNTYRMSSYETRAMLAGFNQFASLFGSRGMFWATQTQLYYMFRSMSSRMAAARSVVQATAPFTVPAVNERGLIPLWREPDAIRAIRPMYPPRPAFVERSVRDRASMLESWRKGALTPFYNMRAALGPLTELREKPDRPADPTAIVRSQSAAKLEGSSATASVVSAATYGSNMAAIEKYAAKDPALAAKMRAAYAAQYGGAPAATLPAVQAAQVLANSPIIGGSNIPSGATATTKEQAVGAADAADAAKAAAAAAKIGLVVGGVIAAMAQIKSLQEAFKELTGGIKQMATSFVSGDMSTAVKGFVSILQGGARTIVTAIGSTIGALVGSIFGPLGAMIGSVLGPMLGAVASKLIGVISSVVDSLDGLLTALGKYNPMVYAQMAQYEMMQRMFRYRMALAMQPVMSAWVQVKELFLTTLVKLAPMITSLATALAPIITMLGNTLPTAIAVFLAAMATAADMFSKAASMFGLSDLAENLKGFSLLLRQGITDVLSPAKKAIDNLNDLQKQFNAAFVGALGGIKGNVGAGGVDLNRPKSGSGALVIHGGVAAPQAAATTMLQAANTMNAAANTMQGAAVVQATSAITAAAAVTQIPPELQHPKSAADVAKLRAFMRAHPGATISGVPAWKPGDKNAWYGLGLTDQQKADAWSKGNPSIGTPHKPGDTSSGYYGAQVDWSQYTGRTSPAANMFPIGSGLPPSYGPTYDPWGSGYGGGWIGTSGVYLPGKSTYPIGPMNYWGSSSAIRKNTGYSAPGPYYNDAGWPTFNTPLKVPYAPQTSLTGLEESQWKDPYYDPGAFQAGPGDKLVTGMDHAYSSISGAVGSAYNYVKSGLSSFLSRPPSSLMPGILDAIGLSPVAALIPSISGGSSTAPTTPAISGVTSNSDSRSGSGPTAATQPSVPDPNAAYAQTLKEQKDARDRDRATHKAPQAKLPQFAANIQNTFQMDVMNEQAVIESMMQVREKLLRTLDMCRQETQLYVATLEGSMIAHGL